MLPQRAPYGKHLLSKSLAAKTLLGFLSSLQNSPREDYKMGGNSSQADNLILRFWKAGVPFQTEVEERASGWLFYFSDLQVEPQFLTLSFY